MQLGRVGVCGIIYLALAMTCSALPRASEYKLAGGGSPIGAEFVPTAVNSRTWDGGLGGEPSCEELRAMWRFSKRQSRATEITNEIPTYRDPFAYNVWEPYARSRSVGGGLMRNGGRSRGSGRHVYGRIVHTAPRARSRDNAPSYRAYEEVAARLVGNGPRGTMTGIPRRKVTSFRLSGAPVDQMPHYPSSPVGSFQQVKDLIRTERARELQEQRLAEEAAARAAALRGLASESYYGQMVHEPPTNPGSSFEVLRYGDHGRYDRNMSQRKGNVVAFPDMLAPTPTKYSDDEVHVYKHRSYPDSMTDTTDAENGFYRH